MSGFIGDGSPVTVTIGQSQRECRGMLEALAVIETFCSSVRSELTAPALVSKIMEGR